MIKAGALDQRVKLQERVTGQDAIGQPLTTWQDIATLWASVKHQTGLSAIKSGADVSIVKVSVRIRYRAGLNAGMRVLHGSVVMDVQAVLPHGREWIDLVCEVAT